MYSSNQGHPQQASGQAHTPTQSLSESSQAQQPFGATSAALRSGSSIWNDRKFQEDYEHCKARMSDSKFNIRNYPDPLLPRQQSRADYYPKGVTAQLEKQLQDFIQKVKEGK